MKDMIAACHEQNGANYAQLANLSKTNREKLVLDALITAYIGGQADDNVREYLAGLCAILNIEKNRLEQLTLDAKAMLYQTLKEGGLGCSREDCFALLHDWDLYCEYLSPKIKTDAIISLRKWFTIGMIENVTITERLPNRTQVDKGQKVAKVTKKGASSYSSYSSSSSIFNGLVGRKPSSQQESWSFITATVSGKFFSFQKDKEVRGLIVCPQDTFSEDILKGWLFSQK